MAGESSCNEFDLRMPRLTGVNQISAGFHRACQSVQSFAHSIILREEFKEPRNNAHRRLGLEGAECGPIESIPLFKPCGDSHFGYQLAPKLDIPGIEIAQQNIIRYHARQC